MLEDLSNVVDFGITLQNSDVENKFLTNFVDRIGRVVVYDRVYKSATNLGIYKDNLEYYNNNVNQKTIDLLFGIRPENLLDERLSSLCKNKTDGIKVKISIAELLGDQYYLHTFIGNNKIISKSTTEQLIQSGDEVKLYIDLDKFHIFDKKSTKRII